MSTVPNFENFPADPNAPTYDEKNNYKNHQQPYPDPKAPKQKLDENLDKEKIEKDKKTLENLWSVESPVMSTEEIYNTLDEIFGRNEDEFYYKVNNKLRYTLNQTIKRKLDYIQQIEEQFKTQKNNTSNLSKKLENLKNTWSILNLEKDADSFLTNAMIIISEIGKIEHLNASETYKEALEIDPKNDRIREKLLSTLYLEGGQFAKIGDYHYAAVRYEEAFNISNDKQAKEKAIQYYKKEAETPRTPLSDARANKIAFDKSGDKHYLKKAIEHYERYLEPIKQSNSTDAEAEKKIHSMRQKLQDYEANG